MPVIDFPLRILLREDSKWIEMFWNKSTCFEIDRDVLKHIEMFRNESRCLQWDTLFWQDVHWEDWQTWTTVSRLRKIILIVPNPSPHRTTTVIMTDFNIMYRYKFAIIVKLNLIIITLNPRLRSVESIKIAGRPSFTRTMWTLRVERYLNIAFYHNR